ncbi:meiotic cell cortex C-terminal pleckstrin homology-domain-containing protein [Flagelloscypha sp. PMI_526]|nr:meiotic cell cortex C-terminal pleckstrin homology-domain-containing protein [Flagelloscypha sp. PMI_526]
MPPPGSMGPPSFIPQKPVPKGGQTSLPPPRPTSPPPRDLIERATTPSLYGTQRARHTSGSSTGYPTNNSGVDRRGSATSSIRDKAYTALSYLSNHSNASLSPRSSMDSARLQAPTTPSRMRSARPMSQGFGAGTNPEVIHAITQTMIGEFMYKYTRKAGFGRKAYPGSGERRHRRFFWVHPYTKTLYWSEGDPGSVHGEGSNAKSAYIEGVRSVLDPNPMPPGLHSYSVVVTTPQREMKITAPTKERHDIWMNALKYLLSRPATNGTGPTGLPGQGSTGLSVPQSPMSVVSDLQSSEGHGQRGRPSLHASPQSQRSGHSAVHVGGNTTTPRGQRSRSQMSLGRGSSVGKRSGTPAAEYLRYGHLESPYSPTRSFVDVDDEDELDFELHGSDEEAMMELGGGPGFDGLENVRACCDGKHTVGGHHHHHHHHHDHETITSPKGSLRPEDRPSSPAWSFRSRAGSTTSSAGGLFGGKLKFGSRREAGKKGSVAPSE